MTDEQKTDEFQLVSFRSGGEEFALDILVVQEIIRPTHATRLPEAPPFVEGILNLRGRLVPVLDLRKRLGMEATEWDSSTRILVVELGKRVVGILVDSVQEVLRVDSAESEPPPDLATGVDADYIAGIVKLDDRMIILLKLDRLLPSDETIECLSA